MSKSELMPEDGYRELLENLKGRIRSSQTKAAIAVNQEMVLLYWQIGQDILIRQEQQGWGSKVVDLVIDLNFFRVTASPYSQ